MTAQDRRQPGAVNRLCHVIGGPERKADVLVIYHCQHDDGNILRVRVGFEALQDCPAVHAGHHHVQRNRGGFQFAGQPQAVFAA